MPLAIVHAFVNVHSAWTNNRALIHKAFVLIVEVGPAELSDEEKTLYKRSALLLPNFSVEMGSFDEAYANTETLELSGTIVAGLIDMRGQINVHGTVVTTFEPQSNSGPVIGNTSPQFNTTLGYFDAASGDLEAELPTIGLGKISLRYDETLPLPDGIDGPITLMPLQATFTEGGK